MVLIIVFSVREYFEDIEDEQSLSGLFELCVKYTKAKDSQNAIHAISCISGFMKMDNFFEPALKRFKFLLAHQKPFIRYQEKFN